VSIFLTAHQRVQSNTFNITLEGLFILCDIKWSWY